VEHKEWLERERQRERGGDERERRMHRMWVVGGNFECTSVGKPGKWMWHISGQNCAAENATAVQIY